MSKFKLGDKVKLNSPGESLPDFMEDGMLMDITGEEQNGAYPVSFTGTNGSLYLTGIAILGSSLELVEDEE